MKCALTVFAWMVGLPVAVILALAIIFGSLIGAMERAGALGLSPVVGAGLWGLAVFAIIGAAIGIADCAERR